MERQDTYWWVAVGILTLWGLVLRIYSLGYLSVWLDEAITILAAKSTLLHGYPLLPSGLVYTGGLIQSYVLAAVGFFFGWSEFWMRLPSVLVGTALIPVSYYIVSQVWNKRVGLGVAAFMALNYWQVAWSRQARMYIFLEFFFLLGLHYTWKFVNEPTPRHGLLLAIVTFFAMITHSFGGLLLLVILAAWVLKHKTLRLPGDWRYQIVYSAIGAIVVWIAIGTLSGLGHTLNYADNYWEWIRLEFLAIGILASLAVCVNRKEQFLVGTLLIYLLVVSFGIPIFAYRYLMPITPLMASLAFSFLNWQFKNKWMYLFTSVILLSVTNPLVLPNMKIHLEPDVPQPAWRENYDLVGHIKLQQSLPLLDAQPVIANYYHVVADGWLKNSLTGLADTKEKDPYLGLAAHTYNRAILIYDMRAAKTIKQLPINCQDISLTTTKPQNIVVKICMREEQP